jgi:hypothetical protein
VFADETVDLLIREGFKAVRQHMKEEGETLKGWAEKQENTSSHTQDDGSF